MRRFLPALLLLCCLLCPALAETLPEEAASALTLAVTGDIKGYQPNTIMVNAPFAGELSLSLFDALGTQARAIVTDQAATVGENVVTFDGLGENEEKLIEGEYVLSATLSSDAGAVTASLKVKVGRCKQALVFALPSAKTLYLGDEDPWFAEVRLVRPGKLCTAFYRGSETTPFATKTKEIAGYKIIEYSWDGVVSGTTLTAGEYRLVFWAEENESYKVEIPVTICEGKRPALPIALTETYLPERGASDAEIWAIMQAPATVVTLKAVSHQKVYDQPSKQGHSLGTLHGQSQTVNVLEVRQDGWAKVGAFEHEDGAYIEGYVPCDRLQTVETESDYGLLLDKKEQTLSLYYKGEKIDTLLISTGMVAKNKLFQETAAGVFFTDKHMADFSTNGNNYDYVIRYDGGNLLHQTAYRMKNGMRDFTAAAALLGTKASHGCVRIQQTPGAGGINAYWLWTHIPYRTKVIVLDDQEERESQRAAVTAGKSVVTVTPEVATPADLSLGETELTLTFGGDAVLGTREQWQTADGAFPTVLAEKGADWVFGGLREFFAADDLTLVNLECVLQDTTDGMVKNKEYIFRGATTNAQVLTAGAVEQVNVANNHFIDYGEGGKKSTLAALTAEGVAYSGFGHVYVWEKDGHKIGFGGCRETVYLEDSGTIRRDIDALRAVGCDVVIYSCHWGTEYATTHNKTQERMAAAAAKAGADIIIGTHPHVVQGVSTQDSALVLWSLGNLSFGGTQEMVTFDATLARIKLRFDVSGTYSGCSLSLAPILTSSSAASGVNDFRPVPAEGDDAARILQKIQADTAFTLKDEMWFAAQ